MKFSIIIPCYNERENVDNLLRTAIPLQKKYDLEWILVENGSTDHSRDYFKNIEGRYPDVRMVYIDANQGYGYGLQQGMKAAQGEYIGWIHADLQIRPIELIPLFTYILSNQHDTKIFLKGRRTNRSCLDRFFTFGQSVFNTILFRSALFDVGAIPVLFHRSLLDFTDIRKMPNDFSIELYMYLLAYRHNFKILRHKVSLDRRKKGKSSWNHGLRSKLRQSGKIWKDSIRIKKGEKVL